MHFPTILALAVAAGGASVVHAQATSSSACAAQPVLDACYASTTALQNGCVATDNGCLCEKAKAVLTCFDQCPSDPRGSSVASSVQLYCMYASASSSAALASATAGASGSSGNGTGMDNSPSSASASRTAASSSSSSSATSSPTGGADQNAAQDRLAVRAEVLGLLGLAWAVL